MAKEYKWKANIGGTDYEIECVISNNRYILYANGEYVTAVYRKLFQNLRGGVNEPVTIGGQNCRFVLWNDHPDLEVSGKLLQAGVPYEEGLKRFRDSLRIMGIAYLCFAALWAVLSLLRVLNWGGLFFAILLIIVGILQLMAWKRTG